jgi:hypothetical protein
MATATPKPESPAFPVGTSPTRVALFAGYFAGDPAGLARHVDDLDERRLYADSVRRWQEYCAAVERRGRNDAEDDGVSAAPSVFGTCRRCGDRVCVCVWAPPTHTHTHPGGAPGCWLPPNSSAGRTRE